jgi:hypothetical protein
MQANRRFGIAIGVAFEFFVKGDKFYRDASIGRTLLSVLQLCTDPSVEAIVCDLLIHIAQQPVDVLCKDTDGKLSMLEAFRRRFRGRVGIALPVCSALRGLAGSNSEFLVEMHGNCLLVAALKTHTGHAGVVEQACAALGNLASNASKALIAKSGGILLLVDALKTHAGHAVVVEAAKATLSSFP